MLGPAEKQFILARLESGGHEPPSEGDTTPDQRATVQRLADEGYFRRAATGDELGAHG